MTDEQLRQETRSVREEFSSIAESDLAADAQISKWKNQLNAARTSSQKANEAHDRVRFTLANLQRQIDQGNDEIAEIDGQRAEIIAAALCDGNDLTPDEELLARRIAVERLVERLTLARPALERRQRTTQRASEIASGSCMEIQDRINERRDTLKLREARRRHGFN